MPNSCFSYEIIRWNSRIDSVDELMPILIEYYGPGCTREWASYKYCDVGNPTFASVAFLGGQPVGITVAGIQKFDDRGTQILGTFSLVNYVHPDHRGKGLYTALLRNLEEQAVDSQVSFMITMPNAASGKGFMRAGYEIVGTSIETILVSNAKLPIRALQSWRSLRAFNPMAPTRISGREALARLNDARTEDGTIRSILTTPFLEHRLSPQRQNRYSVVTAKDGTDAVLMHGHRGSVRECRILATTQRSPESIRGTDLIPYVRAHYSPDIITIRSTTLAAPKLEVRGAAVTRRANPPLLVRTTSFAPPSFNSRDVRLTGIDTHTW